MPVGVHQDPQRWAEEQFAGAKLTDIRRVARVKTRATAMAVHPGRSIPKLCRSAYAVKASYNLFKHVEVTPEHMQSGQRALVGDAMRQPGVSLVVEDTTALSWSGKQALAGLGPIGNSAAGLRGFFVHTVRSVRHLEHLSPGVHFSFSSFLWNSTVLETVLHHYLREGSPF